MTFPVEGGWNTILHIIMDVTTYPYWDKIYSILVVQAKNNSIGYMIKLYFYSEIMLPDTI